MIDPKSPSIGDHTVTHIRSTVKDVLNRAVCDVNLITAEGHPRRMVCTLQKEYMKSDPKSEPNRIANEKNIDALGVYDVEIDGWRAFRIDRLVDVHISDPQPLAKIRP